MTQLIRRISLPLLLLAALVLMAPQTADAGPRRYVRRAYVPRYVAPVAVYAPPVRVYAPAVGVYVGPGVHVRAPGVRVDVPLRYPVHYAVPYYHGW